MIAADKRITVPPIVWAAMAQQAIEPERLNLYQVTDVEVILCVEGLGEVRVEISALPAAIVAFPRAWEVVPDTMQAQGPAEPEHAETLRR